MVKIKKRKGMSLIVLIVTIIILIILASVIIITISNNNPINSAKEATFKEDIRSFQNDLALTISQQYTETKGNRDIKINTQSIPANFDEMKKYISNYTKKYDKKLGIEDDELVYFPDKVSIDEKKWLEDLGIKPWGEYIEEASQDLFMWDEKNDTKIIGYNEEKLKEYLSRNNNILKIPEKCREINYFSFQNCNILVNVIIPDSVNSIGIGAFRSCNNLTSIILSKNITSITTEVFKNCISLMEVEIPESVTWIGERAFLGCTSLNNIIIPNSVTSISHASFERCTSLNNITIPDSVTNIGLYAFEDTPWYDSKEDGVVYINRVLYKYKGKMPKNTEISIKDGTKKISIGAFAGCNNLTSISIPNSVTSIDEVAFNSCTGLVNITIPDSVRYIGQEAFYNCSNLTNVTLSKNSDIATLMFDNCTSLTSIIIPVGVTRINLRAFNGCSSLTSITIPNTVKRIESMSFYMCNSLSNITFNGTINEWNNITKESNWNYGSNIQTITCEDGVINLE